MAMTFRMHLNLQALQWIVVACVSLPSLGCDGLKLPGALGEAGAKRTFHEKFNWNAEDWFTDPGVIQLCEAIQADDQAAIQQAIDAGADVNALGQDNMTPLLWAYPDNRLDRFRQLLIAGADPNVPIAGQMNCPQGFEPGEAVTHLATTTHFLGYFEAVLTHGGNPNLRDADGYNMLGLLIKTGGPNVLQRIDAAIAKGADLNDYASAEQTPLAMAVSWYGQFDLAMKLIERGADYRAYDIDMPQRFVHTLFAVGGNMHARTPQQRADYERLVEFLRMNGELISDVEADVERWRNQTYTMTPQQKTRARAKEVAQIRLQEVERLANQANLGKGEHGLVDPVEVRDDTK